MPCLTAQPAAVIPTEHGIGVPFKTNLIGGLVLRAQPCPSTSRAADHTTVATRPTTFSGRAR